ncbi:MAG TPA: MaoC family dehydratase [Caulobacteraceae bacterium]|nr:MaoC family dehydratase [Caulobacteraceae bacterium]
MQGKHFEDLSIGDFAEMTATVTDETIRKFAEVSGDDNPIHLDEAYAATTQFGERIAHGMLSAGFISAVIGTRLPGPGCIYLSQSLRFRRPVKIGDEVVAKATISALDADKGRATLETVCTVGGKAVIEGEAVVMVPRKAS